MLHALAVLRAHSRLFFNLPTSPQSSNASESIIHLRGYFDYSSSVVETCTSVRDWRWHSHFYLLVCLFLLSSLSRNDLTSSITVSSPHNCSTRPLHSPRLHIGSLMGPFFWPCGIYHVEIPPNKWYSTKISGKPSKPPLGLPHLKNWKLRSNSPVTLIKVGLRGCLRSSFRLTANGELCKLK